MDTPLCLLKVWIYYFSTFPFLLPSRLILHAMGFWGGRGGFLPYCQSPGQAAWWSVCDISDICLWGSMAKWNLPLLDAITPISILWAETLLSSEILLWEWKMALVVRTIPATRRACSPPNPNTTPDISLPFCLYFFKPRFHCKAKVEWLEFQKTSAYELSPIWVM